VEEIFGPKMHEMFPRKLLESPTCGNGFWEDNGNQHYKQSGVMLRVEAGEDVSILRYFTCSDDVITNYVYTYVHIMMS